MRRAEIAPKDLSSPAPAHQIPTHFGKTPLQALSGDSPDASQGSRDTLPTHRIDPGAFKVPFPQTYTLYRGWHIGRFLSRARQKASPMRWLSSKCAMAS